MKSKKNIKTIIGSVCVIISIIIIGCAMTKVPLSNYSPAFTGDLSVYKGKRVYLMNFDNQASDTSIWYYYSQDKKLSYAGNNTLQNYFWYAFQDAFTKLGMLVSKMDNPDLTAPAMWVTLLSITDVNYHVRVTVQKKGITEFTQEYTIQEPPLEGKDPNLVALEQRAYRMTNKLIEAILKDPGFRKVLTNP